MFTSIYCFNQKSLSSAIRFLHLHRLQTLIDNPFTKYESNYELLEQPKHSLQKLQCFLQKNFFNRHVRNNTFKGKVPVHRKCGMYG